MSKVQSAPEAAPHHARKAGIGLAVLSTATFVSHMALAAVSPVTIDSNEAFQPRWLYASAVDEKALKQLKGISRDLAEARAAQLTGDHVKCVQHIRSARAHAKTAQHKGLLPWISVNEIECALRAHESSMLEAKASKKSAKSGGKAKTEVATKTAAKASDITRISEALEVVHRNPSWLVSGPYLVQLRGALVKGTLAVIEQDVKTNRTRAWTNIERVQKMTSFIDDKSRCRLWYLAGDLAFLEQRYEASRDFLKRSLLDVDSEDARTKLAQVESAMQSPAPRSTPAIPDAKLADRNSTPTPPPDASREEVELVDRVTAAMKRGELVPAVDDGMRLIRGYPGSSRAKWATDRVFEAYMSVNDKSDAKSQSIREEIISRMERADGERMADWARTLFNRGAYEDSYRLAQKALKSIDGARRTRVLEIAGDASIATEHYDQAKDSFMELIEKHSGTPASREALLRLGLLHYRMGEYSQSAVALERLLAMPQIENHEVVARYWLWRGFQKTKSERANLAAEELMRRFPFSYYGLRARYERNGGTLEWKPESSKIESKVWMTAYDKETLERARTLMQAGWLEEAQAELKELPPPLRAEDKAVQSLLWAAASGYIRASKLANEAWDEKPELRRPPFVNAAFPSEFNTWIEAQASSRSVNKFLVKGLIKQESGYNVKAVSVSNAMGLMQMIPPTAKEIAADLKLGNLQLPDDMFEPQRNIQMGTYYLSRMLTKYQGHVPLALAAYNAGPGRMDRWLRARPSLKTLPASRSGKPDDEIWFDEIPYSETSFYVKAILRNILLYRMFEKGKVEVSDPVWVSESVATK